ncbi:hypothetical protein [Tenggerimyces flavus]|uniref:Uncharacterized protein n=1 Tax=Tenggerimyces flavus TaxID=1708749 RepID=A0ABV7Y5U4_9ACTN|nr:hypothetical protein [Tenggerimyces flavus]MBM7788664.1 hypothetical protein [Tenggerimyces flavus]
MVSWRDQASQQAQDDLDGLLDPAIGFAQQQLEKYHEFYPYAVVVDEGGDHRMVAAEVGSEQPASADLITTLIASLSVQRDHLRAVAIVADVRLSDQGTDGIRVTLEHAEGVALSVVLPYRVRRLGRGINYGDLQASEAVAFIWAR